MATMSTEIEPRRAEVDAPIEYRRLSSLAVAALVMGLLASLTLLAAFSGLNTTMMISPLALAGVAIGIRAIVEIRRRNRELTGKPLAVFGTALSAFFLVSGVGLAAYFHATEVPPGYTRTSFAEMQPDDRDITNRKAIPDDVMALSGEKVFIKGYMRPPSRTQGIREFLLVRDNNECCFGPLSKVSYHDQIWVQLENAPPTEYRLGKYAVGGTLMIDPSLAYDGAPSPAYVLIADHIK